MSAAAAAKPPLLRVRDLHVSHGNTPVLTGLDLELAAGEFIGVVGRNGAGKTTLLNACLGLLPARRGRVVLAGTPIEELSRNEIARRAAWVPQRAQFGEGFSVRDLVAMGRTPYRGPLSPETPTDQRAIEAALEACELLGLRERRAGELSGGELQRLLFARALAQEAALLILDEPIANLDLSHQIETLERIRDLCRERGALCTFHDLTLAGRYCDRLCVLDDGKIALDAGPEVVLHSEVLARYFEVEARVEQDPERGPIVTVLRTRAKGES